MTGLALVLSIAACSGTVPVHESVQDARACQPGDGQTAGRPGCGTGRNVLLAMAGGQAIAPHEIVEQEVLEEQRGGFIMAGGLEVDFGFQFQTFVNDTPQLTTMLSYDEILAGGGTIPRLNAISVSGAEAGTTNIVHSFGPDGIAATINNSQDGIVLGNVSTLSINIIEMGRAHRGGRRLNGGGGMPLELRQSIIRGIR